MANIGVISDTHGLLRPEAIKALSGSDFIIHAGDIGSIDVIDQLANIAPVTAIRGNVDKPPLGDYSQRRKSWSWTGYLSTSFTTYTI